MTKNCGEAARSAAASSGFSLSLGQIWRATAAIRQTLSAAQSGLTSDCISTDMNAARIAA